MYIVVTAALVAAAVLTLVALYVHDVWPPLERRHYEWDTEHGFRQRVRGKRVVIVGPSSALQGKRRGAYIDSFDTVVRINRMCRMTAEEQLDFGSRTDVHYTCGTVRDTQCCRDVTPAEVTPPVRHVRLVLRERSGNARERARRYMTRVCPESMSELAPAAYEQMRRRMGGTHPNTGIVAVLDVLQHGAAEVYVTGFDFYRHQYSSAYGGPPANLRSVQRSQGFHSQQKQMVFMRQLYRQERPRLRLDRIMRRILAESPGT